LLRSIKELDNFLILFCVEIYYQTTFKIFILRNVVSEKLNFWFNIATAVVRKTDNKFFAF